jgi:excisionase family DNA binding protein
MTLEEVADYLRVTKKTIYRLLEARKIPAAKVGRQWRFDKAAVDDWLTEQSTSPGASILVVDDERVIRVLIQEILQEMGHNVTAVGTGHEALDWVQRTHFDMIFLDLKMPGMDGAELFRRIKAMKPRLPVVIITGYPESELMSRALAHGPFAVMNKPFDESDIVTAVNTFLRITKLKTPK